MKILPAKIAVTLSFVAVLFTLSACQKKSDAASKPRIAVIPKGMTHIYWKSVQEGAEKAGKELGFEIIWTGPERETDRERQIQIIEDFIVQRIDGIVLAPLDRKALVPSVEKLAAEKIPCAIVDSAIDTDRYVTFAATDNYQAGALAARRMGQILEGKGKVVVVKYMPGSGSTTDRENGFTETIQKEFPGIQIVDSKYAQDTVETALQASEDLLTKNQDLQGIFACNASTAVGALQALQSQNRGQVKIVGFDSEKALIDAMKAGQVDSLVVQDPVRMGYEAVKSIAAAMHGQPVEKRIDTGARVLTKESLTDPAVKALLKLP